MVAATVSEISFAITINTASAIATISQGFKVMDLILEAIAKAFITVVIVKVGLLQTMSSSDFLEEASAVVAIKVIEAIGSGAY